MAKKIIIIAIVVILAFLALKSFFQEEEKSLETAKAEKGTVIQEVSETGQVKKGERINLSFKNSGEIENVFVSKGDKVEKGDMIASLDGEDLEIDLLEAKASLKKSQAELDKLLAGAAEEEIKIAETAVENAEIALEEAKQNLKDVKAEAKDDLKAEYEDAVNTLEETYLNAYNAKNTVNSIQENYFTSNDQASLTVKEKETAIEKKVSIIGESVNGISSTSSYAEIESILKETKEGLSVISESLNIIREKCEDHNYKNQVSSTDKTSLDTAKSNIITAITSITDDQQSISSTEKSNETSINTAEGTVLKKEGALKSAQKELDSLIASPRQEDVILYEAAVEQAEAKVKALNNKIDNCTLRNPVKGEIVEIKKEEGETVQASVDVVAVVLPSAPFEIEVDIYEEDVVKVKTGNYVGIDLVAYPGETFEGEVSFIDPAEKIVDGVVYYEIMISFKGEPEGVKPGMSADVVIRTQEKKDVLAVPEDAVFSEQEKYFIKFLSGEEVQKKEVEIGLKGSNDLIEIISGISEGEEVIVE